MDTTKIDINVHPTKQEIKFDDERLVYNYLKVTIRHALGQHSIIPSLDFEQESGFTQLPTYNASQAAATNTTISTNNHPAAAPRKEDALEASNLKNWRKLYEGIDLFDEEENNTTEQGNDASITIKSKWSEAPELDDVQKSFSKQETKPYQIHSKFIVSPIKSGFLLIDQQAAHERILYEQYLKTFRNVRATIQTLLFPKNITLSPKDAPTFKEILPIINQLGFDIQEFGKNTFVIHGIPADWQGTKDEQAMVEKLLEQYQSNLELDMGIQDNIAQAMARQAAIKRGQTLTEIEMQQLIDQLFACTSPYKSPTGRSCFITYELEDLEKQFN